MNEKSKAQIARENGAKSRGPVTPEGKAISSRNALKTGEYATKLAGFLPPHTALICNENTEAFEHLLDQLTQIYRPANQLALSIVESIATARWQIDRLNACITMHWNHALVDAAQLPSTLAPDLIEIHSMVHSSRNIATLLRGLNRQIDQLELRIIRLERRLTFVHANFPTVAEERTHQPVENTQPDPQNEPPLYITENTPAVIAAYKREFPGRQIVILPPDNVAKGIDIEDDMPLAPRKIA